MASGTGSPTGWSTCVSSDRSEIRVKSVPCDPPPPVPEYAAISPKRRRGAAHESFRRSRFDWYSARAVLRQAVERIGAPAGGPFDAKALNGIADALPSLATHVEATANALRQAADAATAKAPAPAPKPAVSEPAPAGPAEAAPVVPADVPAGESPADGGDDAKRDQKKKK